MASTSASERRMKPMSGQAEGEVKRQLRTYDRYICLTRES